MRIDVECYAGFRGNQRPRRFRLDACWLDVVEILSQWYSPDGNWFRVEAADGNVYVLKFRESEDTWTVESVTTSEKNSPDNVRRPE